jgi:hypothetical protein
MVSNLSAEALTAMAGCHQTPHLQAVEGDARDVRHGWPSGVTDILTIGANPTSAVYLSGLFHRFGWTVLPLMSLEDAIKFLQRHEAAVAIFEDALVDGTWRDAARILASFPNPPMLVVIGSDRPLLDEVLAVGGFDVLTRPLRESDVVWTVASAWHQWMKRFRSKETGGPRCSDA